MKRCGELLDAAEDVESVRLLDFAGVDLVFEGNPDKVSKVGFEDLDSDNGFVLLLCAKLTDEMLVTVAVAGGNAGDESGGIEAVPETAVGGPVLVMDDVVPVFKLAGFSADGATVDATVNATPLVSYVTMLVMKGVGVELDIPGGDDIVRVACRLLPEH